MISGFENQRANSTRAGAALFGGVSRLFFARSRNA
jgi:hypothetical protein